MDVGSQLGNELVQIERFGYIVSRAKLHQRDGALDRPVTGDKDPWRHIKLLRLQLFEQVIAVTIGEPDVAHDDVVALLLEIARRTLRGFVPIATESLQRETIDQGFPHDVIVFDEADLYGVGCSQAAIGNVTVKTVWPGLL